MGATNSGPASGNQHTYIPSGPRLFVWQSSTMLLGISILLFLIGLMVFVYDAAKVAGVWGPEIKVAIWFTISMVFGDLTYFISWRTTEWQFQQLCVEADASRDTLHDNA
jgi:hypothetical protein